jgi:hypothetical protein
MLTKELETLLRAKYSGTEYALFFNVADGTGTGAGRWADAIAINLWPSRGLELEGFELKVSRGDWQRELKNPAKAEAVCRYCDRWSVVAADQSIVRDGELPPTWGLLVPRGTGLGVVVKAPKLSPCPLDRSFVAAIARRATEQGAEAGQLAAQYERGKEAGQNERAYELKELRETAEKVAEFEKVTGISLDASNYGRFHYHDGGKIGAAVLQVLSDGSEVNGTLGSIRNFAQRLVTEITDMLGDEPQAPAGNKRRRA